MSEKVCVGQKFKETKIPPSYAGEIDHVVNICFDTAHGLLCEMENGGAVYTSQEINNRLLEYGLRLQERLNGEHAPLYMQDLKIDYPRIGFYNERTGDMTQLAELQRIP